MMHVPAMKRTCRDHQHVKDARTRLEKLQDTSECIMERLEQGSQRNSPRRVQDELGDPSNAAAAPNDVHSDRQNHRGIGDKHVDETNPPRRDTAPGGQVDKWDKSRDVESDRGHKNVSDGTRHDGTCSRGAEDERIAETNALR